MAVSASGDALREQVAERLAAHRRRRGGVEAEAVRGEAPARPGTSRSARIAAAVAERYAHTPTYRAFLAAEAERAIQQARAAAEVAAMNAQAVAAAQQRLLEAFDESEAAKARAAESLAVVEDGGPSGERDTSAAVELNLWPDLEREVGIEAERTPTPRPSKHVAATHREGNDAANGSGGLTVRLYEDRANAAHVGLAKTRLNGHLNLREERNEAEANALDEEIAFRQAPVFEEPAGPPVPLPANLIEFPRHLVASRKARPRYAEGPLREEGEAAPLDGQLRIFEVDPAQISTEPAAVGEADVSPAPQWTSIWLDTPSQVAGGAHCSTADGMQGIEPEDDALLAPMVRTAHVVEAAFLGRRVLAAAINGSIIMAGVLAFGAAFVATADRSLAWDADVSRLQAVRMLGASIVAQTGLQPAQMAMVAAIGLGFLVLTYYALFFWFSVETPGMRCARIGLCTFEDENPTRRAVRRRMGAMLLSACTLGFGFAWAILDEDQLTWHDRITRMYLRRY